MTALTLEQAKAEFLRLTIDGGKANAKRAKLQLGKWCKKNGHFYQDVRLAALGEYYEEHADAKNISNKMVEFYAVR
jgi:hypothetical protein